MARRALGATALNRPMHNLHGVSGVTGTSRARIVGRRQRHNRSYAQLAYLVATGHYTISTAARIYRATHGTLA